MAGRQFDDQRVQDLISLLSIQASRIRELENTADMHLHQQGNIEEYTACLYSKAELLSELFELAKPIIDNLSKKQGEEIARQLSNFSRNAEQAMEVGSIFFMRQLLYPEDYLEGQENDLERLINFLQTSA
jgi:hypothetical protein